jgi:hypothetical protein
MLLLRSSFGGCSGGRHLTSEYKYARRGVGGLFVLAGGGENLGSED